jgi:bifunctional DNA-binding transcriptional regulator/antitoxin component of YhaV-PrlF toxin-antitoxin module
MVKIISRISKATTTSSSLRATIPMEIVEDLKLKVGDVIEWEIHKDDNKSKQKFAKIRKLE